jgi:hypothetical protein
MSLKMAKKESLDFGMGVWLVVVKVLLGVGEGPMISCLYDGWASQAIQGY